MLGPNDILIVGGVIVLLFGGSKIAQLGKGLGEGIREFKTSVNSTALTEELASVSATLKSATTLEEHPAAVSFSNSAPSAVKQGEANA